MEGKTFLKQVQNQLIADLLIDELAAAGFEAYATQGSYPYPHPAGPVEIWLKDSSVLEWPGAQEAIHDILNPPSFDLTSEDAIPPAPKSRLRWWHFFFGTFVLLACWLWIFGKEPVPYQFMKGGIRLNLTEHNIAYFERYTTSGSILMLKESEISVEQRARSELLQNGFEEYTNSTGPMFEKFVNDGDYKREDEFIYVGPGKKQDPNTKAISDDPNVCYVHWGYRPSLAQALRRLLGF